LERLDDPDPPPTGSKASTRLGPRRRFGTAMTSGLTVEDVLAWPDVLEP
jgi:hypothetical protein